MGGNVLPKLNIDSRPISKKYREGKVKRTLKRELKVPEIAKKEANETSFLLQDWRYKSGSALVSLRVAGVVEGDCIVVFLVVCCQCELCVRGNLHDA